ncbi:MAG: response regulator transcription factor [Comamonadaceae bacterium]|nr:MAG: response regulator transcription factor [Comamonadaceae bacterium]
MRGNGIGVVLPAKEFDVALLMLRNLGRPLSREHLRQTVWHGESASGRTIDTHVSRVRLKLGLTAEGGFSLQAIYGIGYRLERTGEARTES